MRVRSDIYYDLIMVDPGGIEPPFVQCECAVLPLNYGPDWMYFTS